jgi:hypothetical protein
MIGQLCLEHLLTPWIMPMGFHSYSSVRSLLS